MKKINKAYEKNVTILNKNFTRVMAKIQSAEPKCKTKTYTEPLLLTIATCQQQSIKYVLGSNEIMLSKNDLGLIVVLVDMLVVLILIFFINFLERRQNEYT